MINLLKRRFAAGISGVMLIAFAFGSPIMTVSATETMDQGTKDYTITNPYETVNWSVYGQYKANYHSHTIESDGNNTPKNMIEDAYAKDFDIYVLSDHNFTGTTYDRIDRNIEDYITSERAAEINVGTDRAGRGMINIPYSNEQSKSDHVNTFWADFNNESGATLEGNIAQCEELGGISHINHPGRYTGARSMSFEDGAIRSSTPDVVGKYVDLFMKYSSCVGMEIINKKDGDSISDRILWDNILMNTMPNRPVWGFSNDDNHSIPATGFSFNMMLMTENTEEAVRYSMENGTFYAVALVSKRELGVDFVASGPFPVINNITVDQDEDTITITGENYDLIEWVADNEIIATGNSIDLNNYEGKVNNYIRAQLKGPGGISFTQPFGTSAVEEPSAVLTGEDVVRVGEEITLNYGLKAVSSVYAQDITLSFDENSFEFVKVEATSDDTVIVNTSTTKAGKVRVVAINEGGVNGEVEVMNFTFKAKNTEINTTSNISITSAELGIAPSGDVVKANTAVKTINIKFAELGDINEDGVVNAGDLAIVVYHYRKNAESKDWEEAKVVDMNNDGVIDIADVAFVASKVVR